MLYDISLDICKIYDISLVRDWDLQKVTLWSYLEEDDKVYDISVMRNTTDRLGDANRFNVGLFRRR